jgi:cytoskeletal protein CcmA (bactofilin family)
MFAKDAKPISTGDGHRAAARQGVPSLISQDMRITGDLVSDGDIQVDGTIDGNVKTGMLTVGEGAQIRGEIEADSVRVCGSVTGQIQARSVEIVKTANVVADIIHETLSIEAGASVTGNFKRADAKAPAPAIVEKRVDLVPDAVPNPLSRKTKDAASK